jgi:hypothetical protein
MKNVDRGLDVYGGPLDGCGGLDGGFLRGCGVVGKRGVFGGWHFF